MLRCGYKLNRHTAGCKKFNADTQKAIVRENKKLTRKK